MHLYTHRENHGKISYTTEFTLWPVPHARPLVDGKPESGAHPAEYLHPGKLHLETSDDNYVDLYIVPPLLNPDIPGIPVLC